MGIRYKMTRLSISQVAITATSGSKIRWPGSDANFRSKSPRSGGACCSIRQMKSCACSFASKNGQGTRKITQRTTGISGHIDFFTLRPQKLRSRSSVRWFRTNWRGWICPDRMREDPLENSKKSTVSLSWSWMVNDMIQCYKWVQMIQTLEVEQVDHHGHPSFQTHWKI